MHQVDPIHDASSNVIFPLGNGVSLDIRIIILELTQPFPAPHVITNKLAEF